MSPEANFAEKGLVEKSPAEKYLEAVNLFANDNNEGDVYVRNARGCYEYCDHAVQQFGQYESAVYGDVVKLVHG